MALCTLIASIPKQKCHDEDSSGICRKVDTGWPLPEVGDRGIVRKKESVPGGGWRRESGNCVSAGQADGLAWTSLTTLGSSRDTCGSLYRFPLPAGPRSGILPLASTLPQLSPLALTASWLSASSPHKIVGATDFKLLRDRDHV